MKKILILCAIVFNCVNSLAGINGVIGQLDWIEVSKITDQEIQRNAKTVGVIYFEKSFCNAFVVGQDKIMTNYHCVSKQRQLESAEFHLDGVRHNCRKLLSTSPTSDSSIIECANNFPEIVKPRKFLGKTQGYVITNNCNFYANPNCKIKKMISFCEVSVSEISLKHGCDTMGGSSGSPVFDEENNLLGIHWGQNLSENVNSGTPTGLILKEKYEIEHQETLRLLP